MKYQLTIILKDIAADTTKGVSVSSKKTILVDGKLNREKLSSLAYQAIDRLCNYGQQDQA